MEKKEFNKIISNLVTEYDPQDNSYTSFSDSDKAIINSYRAVIHAIAEFWGDQCEVVLHSLEDVKKSVYHIANGHVTGRQQGSPLTDFTLKMLHSVQESDRDYSDCYYTKASNGTIIRSVSAIIRNSSGKIIGFLCINMNLNTPFIDILQNFLPYVEIQTTKTPDLVFSDVVELVDQIIENTIIEVKNNKKYSNKTKDKQIIASLYKKGVFDIKDALKIVSEKLNISSHTIYYHIRKLKEREKK